MIASTRSPRSLEGDSVPTRSAGRPSPLAGASVLQRKCACGQHAAEGECEACRSKKRQLQLSRRGVAEPQGVPPIVHEVLRSPGEPLDPGTQGFMEPRFGQDFSRVRVHTDARAGESARAVNALAYTVGRHLVFGSGQYAPGTQGGRQLVAHELAHVVQQRAGRVSNTHDTDGTAREENDADRMADAALAGITVRPSLTAALGLQRRAAPYIKKVTVHLAPSQSADLEWEGMPPATAPGSDQFQVSTGKGYGDPGDPPGTCTRSCCSDPMTQCAPPWNQPSRVGSCCTYYGNTFWTGTPVEEHNGWKWWTPIQPYYSSRGIALHQHHTVTGDPIGHGCVRMEEPNAQRIYEYSNGRRTNVTIDGRAAPVACEASRRCGGGSGTSGSTGASRDEPERGGPRAALEQEPAVAGLEGVMS